MLHFISYTSATLVLPSKSCAFMCIVMCRPTGGKGDLILEVELLFPTHITETQKMLIKSAFFLSTTPSKEQHKALRQFEQAFKDPLHGWCVECTTGLGFCFCAFIAIWQLSHCLCLHTQVDTDCIVLLRFVFAPVT